jgi:hypothetical protein
LSSVWHISRRKPLLAGIFLTGNPYCLAYFSPETLTDW